MPSTYNIEGFHSDFLSLSRFILQNFLDGFDYSSSAIPWNNRRTSPVKERTFCIVSSLKAGKYTEVDSFTGDVRRLFQGLQPLAYQVAHKRNVLICVIISVSISLPLKVYTKNALICLNMHWLFYFLFVSIILFSRWLDYSIKNLSLLSLMSASSAVSVEVEGFMYTHCREVKSIVWNTSLKSEKQRCSTALFF